MKKHQDILSNEVKQEIDHWLTKFPAEQKQSAVIAALTATQKANGGWLKDEHIAAVADYLEMPKVAVMEVATFYTMYHLQPMGKNHICVCRTLSCWLRAKQDIVDYLAEEIGIGPGQVSEDGNFSLEEVECLGHCGTAPVVQINGVFHEEMSVEKLKEILAGLDEGGSVDGS